MSINIFSLASLQPLVYVALAILAVLAVIVFFWGRGPETAQIFLLKPDDPYENWPKWFYRVGIAAVMVLWLVVVIANHTTVWYDIVNLIFLVGFSWVFLLLAQVAAAVVTFLFICAVVGIYILWNCIIY
jgi:hypothetical protein